VIAPSLLMAQEHACVDVSMARMRGIKTLPKKFLALFGPILASTLSARQGEGWLLPQWFGIRVGRTDESVATAM